MYFHTLLWSHKTFICRGLLKVTKHHLTYPHLEQKARCWQRHRVSVVSVCCHDAPTRCHMSHRWTGETGDWFISGANRGIAAVAVIMLSCCHVIYVCVVVLPCCQNCGLLSCGSPHGKRRRHYETVSAEDCYSWPFNTSTHRVVLTF